MNWLEAALITMGRREKLNTPMTGHRPTTTKSAAFARYFSPRESNIHQRFPRSNKGCPPAAASKTSLIIFSLPILSQGSFLFISHMPQHMLSLREDGWYEVDKAGLK